MNKEINVIYAIFISDLRWLQSTYARETLASTFRTRTWRSISEDNTVHNYRSRYLRFWISSVVLSWYFNIVASSIKTPYCFGGEHKLFQQHIASESGKVADHNRRRRTGAGNENHELLTERVNGYVSVSHFVPPPHPKKSYWYKILSSTYCPSVSLSIRSDC